MEYVRAFKTSKDAYYAVVTIESALTVFHHIMGIIDIKLSLNFNNLTKLYSLCKVLATCPVQKWYLMNEDLLFGDSNLKARNIIKKGIGLKKVRSKLQGRCDLDRARLLPLKEISDTLANSNLFSWLWPKYRKARKDTQSIIKMQFNDQTCSLEIQNIIDYLSEEAAFLDDPSVKQTFPTEHFEGIDSDFEGLESWLKYYSTLTEWFQHSGLDLQVFNKITALDKNSIVELRRYAFSSSEPSGDKETEIEHGKYLLDERLNIITKKHKLNSEILDFLKSIDVDTSFKCEFLDALATDVILFEKLTKQLSSGICRTVLEQCPAFDDISDRGLFDSLNEITRAFDNLGLSNEEAKTLLDGRFQDWFYQAQQTYLNLLEIKHHIIDRINKNNAQALNIEITPLEQITRKIENALKHNSHATGYLEFLHSLESVQNEGLDTFLTTLLENPDLSQRLDVAFRFVFYNSLVLEFYKSYPKLFRSVGSKFNEYRINYSELDDRLMLAYQSLLSTKLCSRDIPEGVGAGRKKEYTELSLIQHLTTLERPNVSVRELLGRSKNAIQSLKPVFLMSPLSVAQLLPSEIKFDVVIMDEASQMKPEDAIGSIARSAQVIVVGDPKQMPPSDYFSKSADDEDENEEDFIEIKQESILDLALGSFRNPRRLKWHYRSRSEELIAFSNYHFYEKDLIIFPSAKTSDHAQGVVLEEVKGIYGAGLNHIEAQATVDRAICLIKQRPTSSMMIVAMNQKQSELINDLLNEKEKDDPILEKYRDYWKNSLEPLLVRNLENVQGDERDVVLISTVYGPDSNGHVFQRFGPIGSEYGHRRLNVLYTRAKELMWVITSLDDGRIEASHTSSRGVHAFKNFLNYART